METIQEYGGPVGPMEIVGIDTMGPFVETTRDIFIYKIYKYSFSHSVTTWRLPFSHSVTT